MPVEDFAKYHRERLNPFKGLIIDVAAWANAHNYHRDQQRLHAISMHKYGIVAGLEIVAWNPPDNSVVIYPGIAVDKEGNTIVVSEPQRFYIKTEDAGVAYLTIKFREVPQRITSSVDGDRAEPAYILEAYLIEDQRHLPTENEIELARVSIKSKKAAILDAQNALDPEPNEIDTRYRQLGGSYLRGDVAIAIIDLPGYGRHQEGILNLVQTINLSTDYGASFKGAIGLSEEIRNCALVCLCSSRGFSFNQDQEKLLSNFLNRGGVILGDACTDTAEDKKAFNQSFVNLATRLNRNLRTVNKGHPILNSHYIFGSMPNASGGLMVEDQGMIYSDMDFGCIWTGGKADKPLPRDTIRDMLELGTNIAIYAHQRMRYRALRILSK